MLCKIVATQKEKRKDVDTISSEELIIHSKPILKDLVP